MLQTQFVFTAKANWTVRGGRTLERELLPCTAHQDNPASYVHVLVHIYTVYIYMYV